jgi:hypothetical protein
VVLRHKLKPFDAKDLDAYIDERLRLAGYTGKGIFNQSARRTLYALTGGVPRLVNVVCDGALLAGYGRDLHTIGGDVIREVASDMGLVDTYSTGGGAGAPGPAAQGRGRGFLGLFRRRAEGEHGQGI